MVFGNLSIATKGNCVEITIGAATPSRKVLFVSSEIEKLCTLLRMAASKDAGKPHDPLEDLL